MADDAHAIPLPSQYALESVLVLDDTLMDKWPTAKMESGYDHIPKAFRDKKPTTRIPKAGLSIKEQAFNLQQQAIVDLLTEIAAHADKSDIDHVTIRNVETDRTEQLKVDGVFIFAGMVPNTGWLKDIVPLDDNGYVVADPVTMKTAIAGVFVAGDCRKSAALQLATACSDGVIAAMQLKEYFRDPQSWTCRTCGDPTVGW